MPVAGKVPGAKTLRSIGVGVTGMTSGSIWEKLELPALKVNPEVTRIVTIDPATGADKVIFERGTN